LGRIKKKDPVKLIFGFIFREEKVYLLTRSTLEKKFGRIDFESPIFNFNHTNYYERELGENLKRRFLSFERLIKPESISKIRHFTQRLEEKFSLGGKRRINIDPGYLDLSKLILATTKDYKHRIYLRDGIYAEVTLYYEKESFRAFDWTYPDYRTSEYIGIFNRIRQIYKEQIR
jgi:hypothetical protein